MQIRLREGWSRVRAFLSEGMWLTELQPRTWSARGLALLQFATMVVEGFVRDRLLLRASALTYFTLLSIVPLLAIVGSILTAVGVTENVVRLAVEKLESAFPDVGDALMSFLAESNIAGLGTLGAATLFLTTILGISNIESSLNHIWGVRSDRPWIRRIPDYLAVLVVAPVLFGAALSLGTTLRSQWVVEKLLTLPGFASLYQLGLGQLPTLVLVGALGFLYWFLPNTQVRLGAALLGGGVAAVAVTLALDLYVALGVGAARANALYGGFAQFPLFFVFVYFFWAIVLFGAEIAFAFQNLEPYRRELRGQRAGPSQREAIGLRVALEVARAFRDGGPPLTADELADLLRMPVRTIRSVVSELQESRIVATLDVSVREDGLQLGRPAERITLVDVLAALRGGRLPSRGDPALSRVVEAALGELAEAEAKAAGGQTLADLLEAVPERSAAS